MIVVNVARKYLFKIIFVENTSCGSFRRLDPVTRYDWLQIWYTKRRGPYLSRKRLRVEVGATCGPILQYPAGTYFALKAARIIRTSTPTVMIVDAPKLTTRLQEGAPAFVIV